MACRFSMVGFCFALAKRLASANPKSQSTPVRREGPASAGVLPALVAVGVKFVNGLIAVAGYQRVAVGQADGPIGIADRFFPVDLADHVHLLHLAGAAEGDEESAIAQAFDAAP